MVSVKGTAVDMSLSHARGTDCRKAKIQGTEGPQAKETEKFFDFFGLPRELRDLIYKESLVQVSLRLGVGREPSHVDIHSLAGVDMLLVSRQFSTECLEAEHGRATLVLGERYVRNQPYLSRLRLMCNRTSQLEILVEMLVDVSTQKPFHDFRRTVMLNCFTYAIKLSEILRILPNLRHVKLIALMYGDSDLFASEATILPAFWSLTAIPKLNVLEVYDYTDLDVDADSIKGQEETEVTRMMYTWTVEDPVLRRHENPDHSIDGTVPCGLNPHFDLESVLSFQDASSCASTDCGHDEEDEEGAEEGGVKEREEEEEEAEEKGDQGGEQEREERDGSAPLAFDEIAAPTMNI